VRRKLHNEELNDQYSSSNIDQTKQNGIVGHIACVGRGEAYTGFWWGNLRESDHMGDPGVDGRIILRWIFRKWAVKVWTGSMWLRIGTGGRHS